MLAAGGRVKWDLVEGERHLVQAVERRAGRDELRVAPRAALAVESHRRPQRVAPPRLHKARGGCSECHQRICQLHVRDGGGGAGREREEEQPFAREAKPAIDNLGGGETIS